MTKHEDEIEEFIPKRETEFVILGTMGSMNARTVNDQKPDEAFYYNDSRNQFWNVLQLVFRPDHTPEKLSIDQKKSFLEEHGIAMCNIVKVAYVDDEFAKSPSDQALFQAYDSNNLTFKKVSNEFREILGTKKIYFTCNYKKHIGKLLSGFFDLNGIEIVPKDGVCFLPSPTRCNAKARSLRWVDLMN